MYTGTHHLSQSITKFALTSLICLLMIGCTLPTNQPEEGETAIGGAPIITIAEPLPNANYLEAVPVNIQASVLNAGDDVERIEITANSAQIAVLQSPNPSSDPIFGISQMWQPETLGTYTISIRAILSNGDSSQPATTTINVIQPLPTATGAPSATPLPDPTEESVEDAGIVTPEEQDTDDTAREDAEEEETPDPTATPAEEQDDDATEPDEDAEPIDPTEPPTPTDPPPPTEAPLPTATPTPSAPMASFVNTINVRAGPGTNFDAIGVLSEDDTTEILAVNPNGTWLKVRYLTREGWVFARLATVEGNITDLPREAGPPTPIPTTPPTNTPVPATPTSAVTNNLVPVDPFINPPNPNCAQEFEVGFTVRNDGSASLDTGVSRIRIVRASDGTEIRSTQGALVSVNLAPGGTHRVSFVFSIDVFVGETHRVEFIVDADNQIPETIENDNTLTVDYNMPANCP